METAGLPILTSRSVNIKTTVAESIIWDCIQFSPMYGRDKLGPTAVLQSVSRIDSVMASNGTLLNMKFLPSFFATGNDLDKFSSFLKDFVSLPIHHVQFNVITKEDLINAKKYPDNYRSLTIRVAGYTAYFTELAGEMQDEIIARTSYGSIA